MSEGETKCEMIIAGWEKNDAIENKPLLTKKKKKKNSIKQIVPMIMIYSKVLWVWDVFVYMCLIHIDR